ncbi:MAG TPA: class I SAM-dependent methyltransferase [Dermatophilaceae bacterium]|nr:class I SAM-dependent methyltransferase [Dermatophilaceae bacterium]
MRQDERVPFLQALERARVCAYGPGGYVGQESFMPAADIVELARRAGVAPGTSVLDVCCGVAGPGRLIAAELGCAYLGVDYSTSAIAVARARTRDLPCRFQVAHVPPLPAGPFDVVLLLETMLAFRDKVRLLREVAGVLPLGGRFAWTLEEGDPLTTRERQAMPDADTVWPVPLGELVRQLRRVGLRISWQHECSDSHLAVVDSLIDGFAADGDRIAAHIGERALDELVAAHRLWSDWLRSGRVRKFALVAERFTAA